MASSLMHKVAGFEIWIGGRTATPSPQKSTPMIEALKQTKGTYHSSGKTGNFKCSYS